MRISEYTPLALRTESIPSVVEQNKRWLTEYRINHATLGICSEYDELLEDGAHIIEECGDVFWYLNLLADVCGTTLDELDISDLTPPSDPILEIGRIGSRLANLTKRLIYYKVEFNNESFIEQACLLKRALYTLLNDEIDSQDQVTDEESIVEECLERNIKKLEKRYPNLRFEEKHAVNRNLQVEKEALDNELT